MSPEYHPPTDEEIKALLQASAVRLVDTINTNRVAAWDNDVLNFKMMRAQYGWTSAVGRTLTPPSRPFKSLVGIAHKDERNVWVFPIFDSEELLGEPYLDTPPSPPPTGKASVGSRYGDFFSCLADDTMPEGALVVHQGLRLRKTRNPFGFVYRVEA